MPTHRRFPFILIATLLVLAGCGGGGGGGGAPAQPTAPAEPAVATLGSRAMPDGVVSVGVEGGVRLGATTVVIVDLPAGYPAVARVEAGWSAAEDPAAAVATASAPRRAGRWAVDVPLPATLPAGARVFVRVVHADGSVIESGVEDFALSGG